MDRNTAVYGNWICHIVALRKESVDRNVLDAIREHKGSVALRKESVDRNIPERKRKSGSDGVALRKESVDRNLKFEFRRINHMTSLSARRAWIEMKMVELYVNSNPGRSPQGERG